MIPCRGCFVRFTLAVIDRERLRVPFLLPRGCLHASYRGFRRSDRVARWLEVHCGEAANGSYHLRLTCRDACILRINRAALRISRHENSNMAL